MSESIQWFSTEFFGALITLFFRCDRYAARFVLVVDMEFSMLIDFKALSLRCFIKYSHARLGGFTVNQVSFKANVSYVVQNICGISGNTLTKTIGQCT